MKKCLVTGGSGFIGAHVVQRLVDRGHLVRVLDLKPTNESLGQKGVEFVKGSVCDVGAVRSALQGIDWVFHLAGNPHLWARREQDHFEPNTEGTRIVLDAVRLTVVEKLIHCSTEAILVDSRNRERSTLSEQTLPRLSIHEMRGSYLKSKHLAEELMWNAIGEGVPAIVVNPTIPFGPGDLNFTPPTRMMLSFSRGDFPAYLNSVFNVVDVRDVAEGIIGAAERGLIGQRYVLGAHNLTLQDLLSQLSVVTGVAVPRWKVPYGLAWTTSAIAELLSNFTGTAPIAPMAGVRLARSCLQFDCSKFHKELNVDPRSVGETLTDLVHWFRINGYLDGERQAK